MNDSRGSRTAHTDLERSRSMLDGTVGRLSLCVTCLFSCGVEASA
jgi:hypothetical protein